MLAFRRCLFQLKRCYATASATQSSINVQGYKAHNEPVLEYLPGSKERVELEEKLNEYDGKLSEIPIVIGDEEIRNNDVRFQVRPFDHQNKLAQFYYADAKTVQKAIDVSLEAHRAWEARPMEERAEIFLRAADLISGKYRMDLMAATMLGQAKTIIQGEIDTACELADFYRFNAQWGLELMHWQPLSFREVENRMSYRSLEGFWAAVAPFNFTAISGHLAGAPAFMGNVVVWKASDTSMLSSYICFKILREAGVPAGVINFVPADGPVFGDTVTASPMLAGVNFTGSTKTFHHLWKQVAANIENYKSYPRLIGECGGKNYHMVHPSADAETVANGTIRSAFEFQGQKCSACSRAYVPQSLWPEVKDRLVEGTKNIKMGNPMEADNFISAVIDDKAFARIKGYLSHAKSSQNINVVAGGNCDDSKGYFIEPTVLEVKDPKDKIMNEEIFGPVVSVHVYPDAEYENMIKTVTETSPYGLTGSIYAQDENVISEASHALRFTAGNFYVNDKSTGSVVAQQPFGGARKSGTNDKAGSPHYLLRFVSPQSVKTSHVPAKNWDYPYMK